MAMYDWISIRPINFSFLPTRMCGNGGMISRPQHCRAFAIAKNSLPGMHKEKSYDFTDRINSK
jgi:hypothetical protein